MKITPTKSRDLKDDVESASSTKKLKKFDLSLVKQDST